MKRFALALAAGLALMLAFPPNGPAAPETRRLTPEQIAQLEIPTPPRFAHWRISYTYPENTPPGSNLPVSTEYQITGDLASATVKYASGTVEPTYQVGKYQLRQSAASPRIFRKDLDQSENAEELYRRAYPGFDWVKPEYFAGVESKFGEECAFYIWRERESGAATPAMPPPEGGSEPTAASAEDAPAAWISLKTGLPVAFQRGGVLGRYTFLPKPNRPISLPSSFQWYLEKHAQNLGRRE